MPRANGEFQFDWQGYLCPVCGVIVEQHTNDALNACLWIVRVARAKRPADVAQGSLF